jgi:hypothetical protein
MALAGDDLQRSVVGDNQVVLLRGLRQFIDSLGNDAIKKIIANQVTSPKNKDLTLQKLKDLAEIAKSDSFTSYNLYLESLDAERLTQFAYAAEKYWRIKYNKEDLDGGLNDYVWRLAKPEIISIVLKYVKEFPELSKKGLLEEFTDKKTKSTSEIQEILNKKEQTELAQTAIALESYEREKLGIHIIGGIHDYAYSLTKDQLITTILNMVHDNPELTVEGKIDAIYSKSKPEERKKLGLVALFGGIEDYIRYFSKSELLQLAYAAEAYDLEARKTTKLGGLHDYAERLTKEELIRIVLDYVRANPDLRTKGFLEKLTNGFVQEGGYHATLAKKSREELEKYCYAVEKLDRAGKQMRGGLVDYIFRLTNDQLIEYLDKMSEKHDRIIKQGQLDKIVEEVNKKTYIQ